MPRPKLPEIEKIQNRVRKRYPGSICVQDSLGQYYIQWNEKNLNDTFLLDNTDSELLAWQQASITAKPEQHINRTHPLKQMMAETAITSETLTRGFDQ